MYKKETFTKKMLQASLLLMVGFLVAACDLDKHPNVPGDGISLTGESKSYDLLELGESGVSGVALLEEIIDGGTKLTITLNGTSAGQEHPAHIHFNSAVIGGGIAISLTSVDGETGISETIINETDDEDPIGYNELLDYDGYINVHLSAADLGTVVAQGDIGSNELTGESKTYDLSEVAIPGISGEIVFEERINGFALATIMLTGTPDGGMHPAHIHANSAVLGGGIIFSFNPVDGTTGMSKTGVRTLDDDTPFGYDDVLTVDGYVNVHLSADDLGTLVAQGDIGSNELTGESTTYPLMEVAVPGISGEIVFEERMNGFALATISLVGTPDDGVHPAHIHANSAAEGGGIILSFNPVDGTTGMSKSEIRELDDETPLNYSDVLTIDGYVNVHLSPEDLTTLVAQGDIGSNF